MLKVATVLIYKASFPNNKCYIGLTRTSLSQRKSEHKSRTKDKKYKNILFYNAIRKYGFDSIIWSILSEHITVKDAENAEIKSILDNPFNYNTANGGSVGNITDETRAKISKALKGRVFTVEWKSKISVTVKKIFSNPEEKKLLSERVKKAMWGKDVRERYLEAISKRDKVAFGIKKREEFRKKREIRFIEIAKRYIEGDSFKQLEQKTLIPFGIIMWLKGIK